MLVGNVYDSGMDEPTDTPTHKSEKKYIGVLYIS